MCVFLLKSCSFGCFVLAHFLARTARELIVRCARRATRDKRDTR